MNDKNIVIFTHTLKEYKKKYRNRSFRLLSYSKKEVEDFDKLNNIKGKHYLLKGRKWWFTKEDQCYHEIPKPIRFTWFRNLNAGVQAVTCALVGGVVLGGAGYGTYIAIKGNNTPAKSKDIDTISSKIAVEGRIFRVNTSIKKEDIVIKAKLKDGSEIVIENWECPDFDDEGTYTFTDKDVKIGEKNFDITYEGKTTKLNVKVEGEFDGKVTSEFWNAALNYICTQKGSNMKITIEYTTSVQTAYNLDLYTKLCSYEKVSNKIFYDYLIPFNGRKDGHDSFDLFIDKSGNTKYELTAKMYSFYCEQPKFKSIKEQLYDKHGYATFVSEEKKYTLGNNSIKFSHNYGDNPLISQIIIPDLNYSIDIEYGVVTDKDIIKNIDVDKIINFKTTKHVEEGSNKYFVSDPIGYSYEDVPSLSYYFSANIKFDGYTPGNKVKFYVKNGEEIVKLDSDPSYKDYSSIVVDGTIIDLDNITIADDYIECPGSFFQNAKNIDIVTRNNHSQSMKTIDPNKTKLYFDYDA